MSVEIQTMGEGGIFEIAAVVIDEVLEIQPFTDVEYEILSSARDILAEGSILEAATVATNSANTAAGLASEAASAANDAAGLANSATTSANTAAGAANSAASSANSAAGAANSAAGAANTAASSANSAASAANTAAATAASFVGTGPAGYYATLTALQAAYPAGDTGIYVELEYGHWYYWSGSAWIDGGLFQAPLAVVQTTGTSETDVMSQKAVTDELLKKPSVTLLVGKNKFNKATAIDGKFIDASNGTLATNAAFSASDYIPVIPGTSYRYSGANEINYMAWYNSSKIYISGISNVYSPWTAPADAAYIRITCYVEDKDTIQLEIGTAATAYEAYYTYNELDSATLNPTTPNAVNATNITPLSVTTEKINDLAVTGAKIAASSVSLDKTNFLLKNKNLFNKDTANIGYYVNQGSGVLESSGSMNASDYIPVTAGVQYCFTTGTHLRIAYYNSSKVFISGALAPTIPITTPPLTAFVRYSFLAAELNTQQFEQGAVQTGYEECRYYIDLLNVYEKNIHPAAVTSEKIAAAAVTPDKIYSPDIILPSKIYGVVGIELNIYFDNIVSNDSSRYDYNITCAVGKQYKDFYRVTPTAAGSYSLLIEVVKDNIVLASQTTTLIIKAASVGAGVSKKILVIGDSTSAGGYATQTLLDYSATDVMDVTLCGTQGTAPNLHEGRSGWRASDFVGASSPFYYSGAFDFGAYMAANSFTGLNYVFINLGINDMFGNTIDSVVLQDATLIIARYQTMIDSIKAYDSNIKIGIALTIPCNYSQDAFAKDYDCSQTRWRCKRNNELWVRELIDYFSDKEGNGIFIIPINASLDTKNNFASQEEVINSRNSNTTTRPSVNSGVHPALSGYKQIGDAYWFFIKGQES